MASIISSLLCSAAFLAACLCLRASFSQMMKRSYVPGRHTKRIKLINSSRCSFNFSCASNSAHWSSVLPVRARIGLFFFLRILSFMSSSAPINFPTAAITPTPSLPLEQAVLIIAYAAFALAMASRMAMSVPS